MVAKTKTSGFKAKNQRSKDPNLSHASEYQEGRGFARGGSVKGGSGSGLGRLRNTRAAAKVPDKTEL